MRGICTRFINGDLRFVDKAEVVVFRIFVIIRQATAAAEDRAVWHVVLKHVARFVGIQHTERATFDFDSSLAAILGVGFDSINVGFVKAKIITLTHGSQVAAAEHVAHHIAAGDFDVGVAIHLTRGHDEGRRIVWILQSLTLAAAVYGMTDEASIEGDAGVFTDMAVLGAAIHGAGDAAVCRCAIVDSAVSKVLQVGQRVNDVVDFAADTTHTCIRLVGLVGKRFSRGGGIVDSDFGCPHVGQVGYNVSAARLALAAAKDVAVVLAGFLEGFHAATVFPAGFISEVIEMRSVTCVINGSPCIGNIVPAPRAEIVLTGHADTTARDFDGCLAGVVIIGNVYRPAEVELILVITSTVYMSRGVFDAAHRSQLAAAVDALLDPAAADADSGVAHHTGRQLHGRDLLTIIQNGIFNVVAAAAAAVHVAPQGAAADGDARAVVFIQLRKFAAHSAQLTAAVHIALDGGALALVRAGLADGEGGVLHTAPVLPLIAGVDIVKLHNTAHTAGEDIAARGVVAVVGIRLPVVADGAARDVDSDSAVVSAVNHLAVFARVGGRHEEGTHRGQTAAAVYGAEHDAAVDVQVDVAAHHTCGEGLARETTTATEDVAVQVRTARGADDGIIIGLRVVSERISPIDLHRDVFKHVAVLAATEDGAVNDAALHRNLSLLDVGPGVEFFARVALACTKEVTGDRMELNLVDSARHAQGATAHGEGDFACVVRDSCGTLIIVVGEITHVGGFATAVHTGENMAVGDIHRGIAPYLARVAVPMGLIHA